MRPSPRWAAGVTSARKQKAKTALASACAPAGAAVPGRALRDSSLLLALAMTRWLCGLGHAIRLRVRDHAIAPATFGAIQRRICLHAESFPVVSGNIDGSQTDAGVHRNCKIGVVHRGGADRHADTIGDFDAAFTRTAAQQDAKLLATQTTKQVGGAQLLLAGGNRMPAPDPMTKAAHIGRCGPRDLTWWLQRAAEGLSSRVPSTRRGFPGRAFSD